MSASENIAQQTLTTYEDYNKLKTLVDVGYFLQDYVVSGGVVTKDVTYNNKINITELVSSFENDVTRHSATSFTTAIASTTYYLDYQSGDFVWATSHPTGTYQPIAEVTTDGNKNVLVITDKRGSIGGFRLLPGYIYPEITDLQALQAANEKKTGTVAKSTGQSSIWETLAIDTFDNADKWEFNYMDGTASPPWTVASNKISSPSAQAKDCLAFYKGVKLSDGRVQVIYENPKAAGDGSKFSGLVLRAKTTSDPLIVVFQNGNPGRVEIWAGSVLTNRAGLDLLPTDTALTEGVPLALEVEIVGLTLKVYVNGHKLLEYTSDIVADYMFGECGLIADKSQSYNFSNFSIRKKRFDIVSPDIDKVLCLGTSITFGQGTSNPWPSRFQLLVNDQFASKVVSVINGGVQGDTSSQMLARLPALLSTHAPDVVIVEASINDFRFTTPFTFETSLFNLRKMVKLVKQTGAIPLVSTITSIDPTVNSTFPDMNETTWQRAYQMNVRVRQLAGEEGVRVIDNSLAFNGNFATLTYDKLHPNDAGYDLIAQTTLDTFFNH